MYNLLLISLLLISSACGRFQEQEDTTPQDLRTQLQAKYDLYLSLLPSVTGSDGWTHDHCDALLFASLTAVGAGRPFPVERARDSSGRWHRRSLTQEECYDGTGGSISRDMFTGLMTYAWTYKRLDILEQLYKYGDLNNWKMGEGDSRTVFTPNLITLLARLIYALGGTDYKIRHSSIIDFPVTGFGRHLQALTIYLGGQALGSLSQNQLELVTRNFQEQPWNPLHSYLYHKYSDGDYTDAATTLLTRSDLWPVDRLPNSADRCEVWITQRDSGDVGFQPCPDQGQTHDGGDFLFVAKLILGSGE